MSNTRSAELISISIPAWDEVIDMPSGQDFFVLMASIEKNKNWNIMRKIDRKYIFFLKKNPDKGWTKGRDR